MPFYLNNLKQNFFIFKIKNNFTTTWNKMKDDSTVFLLGYIFCAPINYNSLGWVVIPPSIFWWPQFCASQKTALKTSTHMITHWNSASYKRILHWNKLLISFVSYCPVDDITLSASFRVNWGIMYNQVMYMHSVYTERASILGYDCYYVKPALACIYAFIRVRRNGDTSLCRYHYYKK